MKLFLKLFAASLLALALTACGNGSSSSSSGGTSGTTSGGTSGTTSGGTSGTTSGGTPVGSEDNNTDTPPDSGVEASTILPPA